MFGHRYRFIILGRSNKTEYVSDNRIYKYYCTDYSLPQLADSLQGVDAVVHLSGRKVGPESHFIDYVNDNILVSQRLIASCHMLGIKNIVNLSSRMVYDLKSQHPWSESTPENPLTFYGISKCTVDKLIHFYNETYQMHIKSLRVSQVIGLDGNRISDNQTGFMPMKFIQKALRSEPLTIYGSGEGKRDYIYIRDVIDAIDHALQAKEAKGIFNIGSGTAVSHKELAVTINNTFNKKNSILYNERVDEDMSINLLDIKKAETELGFIPKWPLKRALLDMKAELIP
jgi:UDP-glucose 4-epimerase